MAKKYYAVKTGRKPGVYLTWDACKTQVFGFPGAIYKSFPTMEEAQDFAGIQGTEVSDPAASNTVASDTAAANTAAANTAVSETEALNTAGVNSVSCYAFVDGSYNIATKVYGYGGFLVDGDERYTLQGSGDDPELASMRNVAGEVAGSMAAIAKAVELGITDIKIYYDYMGIEMWATGAWKRNKKGTAAYYEYVQSVKDKIHITFCKVRGHSGVEGNEEADHLAKEAVGNL